MSLFSKSISIPFFTFCTLIQFGCDATVLIEKDASLSCSSEIDFEPFKKVSLDFLSVSYANSHQSEFSILGKAYFKPSGKIGSFSIYSTIEIARLWDGKSWSTAIFPTEYFRFVPEDQQSSLTFFEKKWISLAVGFLNRNEANPNDPYSQNVLLSTQQEDGEFSSFTTVPELKAGLGLKPFFAGSTVNKNTRLSIAVSEHTNMSRFSEFSSETKAWATEEIKVGGFLRIGNVIGNLYSSNQMTWVFFDRYFDSGTGTTNSIRGPYAVYRNLEGGWVDRNIGVPIAPENLLRTDIVASKPPVEKPSIVVFSWIEQDHATSNTNLKLAYFDLETKKMSQPITVAENAHPNFVKVALSQVDQTDGVVSFYDTDGAENKITIKRFYIEKNKIKLDGEAKTLDLDIRKRAANFFFSCDNIVMLESEKSIEINDAVSRSLTMDWLDL